jgi:hypothetical protein
MASNQVAGESLRTFIAGRRHTVVPPVNAEYLHERLPHSELRLLESGHFAWEYAVADYAALVNAWWADGNKASMMASTALGAGSSA